MNPEAIKRRQSLKVIVSEVIMVVTVIITVIILAFIVSGYWLNSDFEVERQGMLQISSVPTGADVSIDGETSWLQRTNTSKVLASGEHTITLSKEGYDSWSKTINISEGLLYRIHYPRLFLANRTKTPIVDTIGTTKVFVAPNHNYLLLYSGDPISLDTNIYAIKPSTELNNEPVLNWAKINLDTDEPKSEPVTLEVLYSFFKKPDTVEKEKETESELVKKFNPNIELSGSEKLIFSKFYDDRYLTTILDNQVTVYKKDLDEPVMSAELSFIPENILAGHDGEFCIFSINSQIATLDMETLSIKEWVVDGPTYDWFDSDMLYSVKDGELFVYDFDGLNRRSLANSVSSRFPVILTNDKYLYYFSDDNLMREQIVE